MVVISLWKSTNLWKHLLTMEGEVAGRVRNFLEQPECMHLIERVLKSGSPDIAKDFTLHDEEHSFRVAQRMWEIIPEETKGILSSYEILLLILSAYCHDIGMTPSYNKVSGIQAAFEKNNNAQLPQHEKKDLQSWLDRQGINFDLDDNNEMEEGEKLSLLMSYCRSKHNDWSEEWIRTNLSALTLLGYTGWLQNLVDICKSHHFGKNQIASETFNPIIVDNSVVHLRYIALCLRLADVMEIDPERAPVILLNHRSVIEGSIPHWFKEQFASISIVEGKVIVVARPTHAFIHKAVVDASDWIEAETRLCHQLIEERPLSNIVPNNNLKHAWHIEPNITRDIREGGSYEYIDGTFRPNSKKLIELLAGTQLYDDPIVSIREVLQNALDAIKIQIGFKIHKDNILDPSALAFYQNRSNIDIRLFSKGGCYWFSCKDNGVGMDKETIKSSFLVAGAGKNHEIISLERECEKLGYPLNLTGHFGIGVLSYFMIADEIIMRTKRSAESTSGISQAWEFSIKSLDDFGELRMIDMASSGTEILLRLKPDSNITLPILQKFVKELVAKPPCRITLNDETKQHLDLNSGWSRNEDEFRRMIMNSFDEDEPGLVRNSRWEISMDPVPANPITKQHISELRNEMSKSLRIDSLTGDLGGNIGTFRITIPYFLIDDKASFAYYYENLDPEMQFYSKSHFSVSSSFFISWKGLSTAMDYRGKVGDSGYFLELDFTNSNKISVNVSRKHIQVGDSFKGVYEEVRTALTNYLTDNAEKFFDHSFGPLNLKIMGEEISIKDGSDWYQYCELEKDIFGLRPTEIPLLYVFNDSLSTKYYIADINLSQVYRRISNHQEPLFWGDKFEYERAMYVHGSEYKISYLQISSEFKQNKLSYIGNSAKFCPEWSELLCVKNYSGTWVFNQSSPLFFFINKDDTEYIESTWKEDSLLDQEYVSGILGSTSRCVAAFIYKVIKIDGRHDGVSTIQNEIFEQVLRTICADLKQEQILCLYNSDRLNYLFAYSPGKLDIVKSFDGIGRYLERPSVDWVVVEEDEQPNE